jgi:hypothetical protein
MAVADTILATTYNAIRAKVDKILGVGTAIAPVRSAQIYTTGVDYWVEFGASNSFAVYKGGVQVGAGGRGSGATAVYSSGNSTYVYKGDYVTTVNTPTTPYSYAYYKIGTYISGTVGTGYGNSLASSTVSGPSTGGGSMNITEAQWDNLRSDISKAYQHQIGALPTITDVGTADSVAWAHAVQYDLLADSINTNNSVIYTGGTSGANVAQSSVSTLQTKSVAGWDSTKRYAQLLTYVRWSSQAAMRSFFNAGGYIGVTTSLTADSGANTKTIGWRDVVCPGMALSASKTSGYDDILLGLQAQKDLIKYDTTSPYTENYGYVRFIPGDTWLQVLVQFVDSDTGDQKTPPAGKTAGPAVDEPIQGTFYANIVCRTSINQVTVETPSVDNVEFTVNT